VSQKMPRVPTHKGLTCVHRGVLLKEASSTVVYREGQAMKGRAGTEHSDLLSRWRSSGDPGSSACGTVCRRLTHGSLQILQCLQGLQRVPACESAEEICCRLSADSAAGMGREGRTKCLG